MASTGRSNSSLSIRQALMSSKRFDDVNHAVSISAYFNVAEKLYDEAKSIDFQRDTKLNEAYVACRTFCSFVTEKLPKHKSYKKNDVDIMQKRNWCERVIKEIWERLERIVEIMDHEQDIKLSYESNVCDEFDCLNGDFVDGHSYEETSGKSDISPRDVCIQYPTADDIYQESLKAAFLCIQDTRDSAVPEPIDFYPLLSDLRREAELWYTLHITSICLYLSHLRLALTK